MYQLKSPKITSFRLPTSAFFTVYCLLGAAYVCLAPPQGTALPFMPANIVDMVFTPARALVNAIGFRPSMGSIIQTTTVFHAFESIYMWYLCRRCVQGSFATVS